MWFVKKVTRTIIFVRTAIENETIHRTIAPTCAELLQSALDRSLLSPSSPTPNSQPG
jgi:hypothetical protein